MSDPMIQPTIGRIVHYVMPGGGGRIHLAAIVTEVRGTNRRLHGVNLSVFPPPGIGPATVFQVSDAPYDPNGRASGSWHWPERHEAPTRNPATPQGDPQP